MHALETARTIDPTCGSERRSSTARVFVVGADPFSMAMLPAVELDSAVEFVPLLGIDDVRPRRGDPPDFLALVREAERRLRADDGPIDAVVGWWDFPTTGIVPILQRRFGLHGAEPRSVAALEHKYWSRKVQLEVVPDHVPLFAALDPFASDAAVVDFPFPFWIKPIKSHSSHLGLRVGSREDLRRALDAIRRGIARFGEPFDQFLSLLDLPPEVAGVSGHHCLIEEIISTDHQCTLEGYSHRGDVVVYGVVDSIRSDRNRSSFSRYQYPSRLPPATLHRMIDATQRVIRRVGYDDAPFNAEFFWNQHTDVLWLLEVNCRISKSHCPLFLMVDGASHQKVLVELALGRKPAFPRRQGRHGVAAKFMIRAFEDGVMEQVPDADDLANLRHRFPDARFKLLVEEGSRLANLPYQDSYSFELAELYLGAPDSDTLVRMYDAARRMLPLRHRPTSPGPR